MYLLSDVKPLQIRHGDGMPLKIYFLIFASTTFLVFYESFFCYSPQKTLHFFFTFLVIGLKLLISYLQ